jgi:hypothetical protein
MQDFDIQYGYSTIGAGPVVPDQQCRVSAGPQYLP